MSTPAPIQTPAHQECAAWIHRLDVSLTATRSALRKHVIAAVQGDRKHFCLHCGFEWQPGDDEAHKADCPARPA
jgi:hypothetical protein